MTVPAARAALPWPLLLLGALMLGFLVAPLLTLAGVLPSADPSAYAGGGTLPALGLSVLAATVATLADAAFGIPLGLWLARTPSRLRHAVTGAVLIPLAIPPVVGGLLLLLWLEPQGWLGAWLDRLGLDPLNTPAGTVLAQMFVAAPFVVLSARAAFGALDRSLEDAARTLGSTPLDALLRVVLPSARRGIATGLVLGWVRCLGEFGATAVVAYHPYTLPVLTFVRLTGEGLPTALPAGALLAVVGAVAAATMLWLDARRPARVSQRSALPARLSPSVPLAWIVPADGARRDQPVSVRAALSLDGFHLDVAFEAPAGIVALLGASGAGKSLTLSTVAGLTRPYLGRVSVAGRMLMDTQAGVDLPPERRGLGYATQRDALFEHLDVDANIGFALHRAASSERGHRTDELVASFGLTGVRHARPATLSGGERQRVALARALAAGPASLLLDEPFASLDAPVRRELRNLVRELHERTHIPIVLVTHDREDALDLADHVVMLERGRVVQVGPIDEVFARPVSRSVARLLGIPNVLAVRSLQPAAGGQVRAETDWGTLLVAAPDEANLRPNLPPPCGEGVETLPPRCGIPNLPPPSGIPNLPPPGGNPNLPPPCGEGRGGGLLQPGSDTSSSPGSAAAWELAIPSDAIDVDPHGTGWRILARRPAMGGWRVWVQPAGDHQALEAIVPHGRVAGLHEGSCSVRIDAGRCHLMPADASGEREGKATDAATLRR